MPSRPVAPGYRLADGASGKALTLNSPCTHQDAGALTAPERERAADALYLAEVERAPIAKLTQRFPTMSAADAYRIQLLNVERRVRSGAIVRGHKVGLSSRVMQQMMGVSEPDYGHLLSDMFVAEKTPIDTSTLCAPRVEVEIAFVLAEALPHPVAQSPMCCAAQRSYLPHWKSSTVGSWTGISACPTPLPTMRRQAWWSSEVSGRHWTDWSCEPWEPACGEMGVSWRPAHPVRCWAIRRRRWRG